MRRAFIIVCVLAACGRERGSGNDDAATPSDAPGDVADIDAPDDAVVDAVSIDAPIDAPTADAFSGVIDMRIDCHNTCVLTANPPRIDVPTGTEFTVNWINVGDTECDVAKIDQFNQVPIIIGLEPGMSYHDTVREWCGTLFTGTFDFRVTICTIHSYIPVDCSAP
ncbi:MAG: hypothetical protein AB7T06_35980 [Kofleriaceae bacterium]